MLLLFRIASFGVSLKDPFSNPSIEVHAFVDAFAHTKGSRLYLSSLFGPKVKTGKKEKEHESINSHKTYIYLTVTEVLSST